MKIAVISNPSGKMVAAMRLAPKGPIGVGMRSRNPQDLYHELDIPEEHKSKGIAEIVKRIQITKPGDAPRFI
jgi:hypothetical protein